MKLSKRATTALEVLKAGGGFWTGMAAAYTRGLFGGVEVRTVLMGPDNGRIKGVGAAALDELEAAAQPEQPMRSGEKSDPPEPAGPAEAPAAPKPADPAHDEPPADDHGSVDDDDPFVDYFVEIDRGLEALKRAWLRAPVGAREYFLSWLASGWRSPEAHH